MHQPYTPTRTHTHSHPPHTSKLNCIFFSSPNLQYFIYLPAKSKCRKKNYLNLIKNIVFVFSLSLFFPPVSRSCVSRVGNTLESNWKRRQKLNRELHQFPAKPKPPQTTYIHTSIYTQDRTSCAIYRPVPSH